ncbi:DUF1642 domain-containing protein [Streptococcus suis]|uniref:DUF1642 domain-containing protein n=1 Tax=Streptococcus suis TaxID=1307 RepID=UPI00041A48E2|nr:DUF1642 domain-containing protein [Streptococcus suis]
MGKMEFYEVDGHQHFIPVKIIDKHADFATVLQVEVTESGQMIYVPKVYKFQKEKRPQKVVVPKFVAEWYERNKYNLDTAIYGTIAEIYRKVNGENNDLLDTFESWFIHEDNPIFILVQMQLFGYEIEQEKLYTVEIPNPNDEHLMTVLKRLSSGKVIMCTVHRSNIHLFENEEFQLTESEIKEDFAWAWDQEFAKKVDKNDE